MTAAKRNEVVTAGVIALIADHFAINEVFTEEKIKEHVRENNSVGEVFNQSHLVEWANQNGFMKRPTKASCTMEPEDLFSKEELSTWAKANGFVEEMSEADQAAYDDYNSYHTTDKSEGGAR